ncbi:MAG: ABC transporter ATP-binding protein [Symbiobacterium sp.]|uniref:ABC transporter ATP-binding protein n=1 Tax=Symbiobacterium sp. TaxID=1971213 RepID=UPI003463BD86
MAPLLEVRNLTKTFGGLCAVRNVSFSVQKGEVLSIIGPNGAGKTTVFNLISGFHSPTEGEIRFKGEVINRLKPYQRALRGLGRTFQIVKPFPGLSILENVMVGAFARTNSVAQAREDAMRILAFVGLEGRAHLLASTLTLAGRKRLEVARALATKPDLILLDEVSAGLNPTEVEEMIGLLRRLADLGVSSVAGVEHVMQVVMTLSDRVVVLNHGEMIAEGTPQEVVNHPAVVAAYLGGEVASRA